MSDQVDEFTKKLISQKRKDQKTRPQSKLIRMVDSYLDMMRKFDQYENEAQGLKNKFVRETQLEAIKRDRISYAKKFKELLTQPSESR